MTQIPETVQSDQWHTPEWLIKIAREILGNIDLDPASNPVAQQTIQATRYFTALDNGLDRVWSGNVWLNPPYSKESGGTMPWVVKLLDSPRVMSCLLLTNASTSTKWWQLAASQSNRICFFNKRISFTDPGGNVGKGNRYDQTLFLFTKSSRDCLTFDRLLANHGHVTR